MRAGSLGQLVAGTITFGVVIVLGIFIGGVSLIPTLAAAATAQEYERAGYCAGGSLACYGFLTGTLEDVQVNNTGPTGGCHVTVSSSLGSRVEFMALRSDCDGYAPGQKVRLKVWQQRITAIAPYSAEAAGRTTDNPVWVYENDRTGVIAGFLIAATGLIAWLALWWRHRRAGQRARLAGGPSPGPAA